MRLFDKNWNPYMGRYEHVWLADSEDEITADCVEGAGEGDVILALDTGSTWVKNTEGKWQKVGTTEVKA